MLPDHQHGGRAEANHALRRRAGEQPLHLIFARAADNGQLDLFAFEDSQDRRERIAKQHSDVKAELLRYWQRLLPVFEIGEGRFVVTLPQAWRETVLHDMQYGQLTVRFGFDLQGALQSVDGAAGKIGCRKDVCKCAH